MRRVICQTTLLTLVLCSTMWFAAACRRSETQTPASGSSSAPPASHQPMQMPSVGLYVTNEQSGDLTVIDVPTLKVVATIPLGKRPRGIAASPDGSRLYVALSGSPSTGGVEG